MNAKELTAGIVCILDKSGKPVGTGFVLSQEGLIATCAHVIQHAGYRPGDTIELSFKKTNNKAEAIVEPDGWSDRDANDMAILRLKKSLPRRIKSLNLELPQNSQGYPFISYGFPAGPYGEANINGVIVGFIRNNQILEIKSDDISPGASGAPVFDNRQNGVVGMISSFLSWTDTDKDRKRKVAGDRYARRTELNYAIPTELLFFYLSIPRYHWLQKTGDNKLEIAGRVHSRATLKPSLPAQFAGELVGRDEELKRVVNALKERKSVVIYGGSGVGKTTLVNRIVHCLQTNAEPVFETIYWPFQYQTGQALTADDILDELARYTGAVAVLRAESGAKKRRAFKECFKDKNFLLVLDLDNVKSDVRKIIKNINKSCTVLVSNREKICGLENVQLAEFDPSSSDFLKLFTAQYRADKNDKEPTSEKLVIRDIFRHFHPNPLVIDLLARTIRAKGYTLEEFWRESRSICPPRLESESFFFTKYLPDCIKNRMGHDDIERTITPVTECILKHLPFDHESDYRDVLTGLSIFQSPASLPALESVTGLQAAGELGDIVSLLVDRGLVQQVPTEQRYYLSPSIKKLFQPEKEEGQKLRQRLACYLADDAWSHWDQVVKGCFEALEPERDNLLAVWEDLLQSKKNEKAARLATLMSHYWLATDQWRHYETWLTKLIEAEMPSKITAWAGHQRGLIQACQSRYKDAVKSLEETREKLTANLDEDLPVNLTRTYHNLGVCYEALWSVRPNSSNARDTIQHTAKYYSMSLHSKFHDPNIPTLDYLEALQNKKDSKIRASVIKGIMQANIDRAWPLLCEDLQGDRLKLHGLNAVKLLDEFSESRFLTDRKSTIAAMLIAAFQQNPSPEIVKKSLSILSKISPDQFPQAIDALLERKNPGYELTKLIAGAVKQLGELSEIRCEEKLDRLQQAIAHQKSSIRKNAVTAAGEISESCAEALRVVIRGLGDNSYEVSNPAKDLVKESLKKNQKETVKLLARTLLDPHNDYDKSRIQIVQLLGEFGEASAVQPLTEAYRKYEKDVDVEKKVLEALGKIDTPQTIPLLVAALKSKSSQTWQSAEKALKTIKNPEVLPELVKALLEEDKPDKVIEDRIVSFGQTVSFGQNAVSELQNNLGKHTSRTQKSRIVQTLGKMATKNVDAIKALLAAYTDETIRPEIDKAFQALIKQRRDSILRQLQNNLGEPSFVIQKNAAHFLGEYGNSQSLDALEKAYQDPKKSRDTKLAQTKAIGRIAEREKNNSTLRNKARKILDRISEKGNLATDVENEVKAQIKKLNAK